MKLVKVFNFSNKWPGFSEIMELFLNIGEPLLYYCIWNTGPYHRVCVCVCVCVCVFFDWGYEIDWPSPFFLLSSTSFPHLTFLGTKIIRFLLLFCYLAERNTFNENSSTFCWLTNILINANTYKHTDKCKHLQTYW